MKRFVEFFQRAKGRTYTINGRNLYVQIGGPHQGAPVVLLHHGLGSVRSWKKMIPSLVAAGYRTVAYDRWGYGHSDTRPGLSLPTFEEDQRDLLTLFEQIGIRRAILIGHSDGGTLGLYFSVAYPERVAGLVTVAAHIYVESKMSGGIQEVMNAFKSDPEFRRKFRRAHGRKYREVFYNWYDGWTNSEQDDWDMRPLLGQIKCPTLVIQGLEDEHATPQHARDIADSIPGAQLWLASDAMHMLPLEQPQTFNQKVIAFLGSIQPATNHLNQTSVHKQPLHQETVQER